MTDKQIKAQVAAVVQVIAGVAKTIRELGSVPSGHLYATLMTVMSYEQYGRILDTLQKAELVRVENHLITWTGPVPERN